MRRFSPLTVFMWTALVTIVLLTAVWTQVSAWTSYPVGVLSATVLEQGAPGWVRKVQVKAGVMDVETSVAVAVPSAGGRRAELTVDASPSRYSYGLPIFWALLLAARGKGRVVRAAVGYVLLLPAQVFSTVLYVLMQLILAVGLDARLLRVDAWQLELIVFGYQVGALVLPTLVPIVIWLWLDRQWVSTVLLSGWFQSPASSKVAPSTDAGVSG